MFGAQREAGLFDQGGRGLFEIVWIGEASLKGGYFLAKFEDALFEAGLILGVNVGGYLEVNVVVIGDGEAQAVDFGLLYLWDARRFSEVLDEELVV